MQRNRGKQQDGKYLKKIGGTKEIFYANMIKTKDRNGKE